MALAHEIESCIANITARNGFLNAFCAVSMKQEIARDVSIAQNRTTPLSKVDGKAIAVKDNICTFELPTTCASNMLQGFLSPYEAPVVAALRRNGGIIVGKTNMDEFGMGSHSTHSHYGSVINPTSHGNDNPRSAGGSSGGSAVAVAADMCYAALGSDTGGSVRLPASYCGIVGFKPSYGRVSRSGLIAYAHSLDTVGVLGKNVQVVRDIYGIMDQFDSRDPTSLPIESREKIQQESAAWKTKRAARPLKIGVPIDFNINELSPLVLAIWLSTLYKLSDLGHSVFPIQLPRVKEALSAYYIIAPAEASSNLAKYDGIRYGSRPTYLTKERQRSSSKLYELIRKNGFGGEVQRRIVLGTYTLSAEAINNYFIKAQKVRRMVKEDFDNVFAFPNLLSKTSQSFGESEDKVDFLLAPTAVTTAPLLNDIQSGDRSSLDAYVNDVFTVPASMAGIPAMSIPVTPAGEDDDLPVGMQIMAQYGDEEGLFDFAEIVENLQQSIE